MGEVMSSILLHVGFFFSVDTQKDVVGITRHVVTTISAFSFTMLLLDRILTHIVNHLSNTSYHFQYLYYPGGNETGAKPNLIPCITEIFLSVDLIAEFCLIFILMNICKFCISLYQLCSLLQKLPLLFFINKKKIGLKKKKKILSKTEEPLTGIM
jgi:hypothetical protein